MGAPEKDPSTVCISTIAKTTWVFPGSTMDKTYQKVMYTNASKKKST